jgi:hypothetical protein
VAAIGGTDADQDLTYPRRDNVLLVHWHDLGRYLGVYGHADVASPRLDQLAAEGILFTSAHATAPLCSPSRGSLFTGRYPQSNGLVGLAHHGWEYRSDVRTLPQILSENGWYSVLFGMQHETSYPSRLGFDEFDVSNSYCEYVVEGAQQWLRDHDTSRPFLLTAGFFETHRPYPRERYEPADAAAVEPPDYLPDTVEVRQDLAEFYGSITTADAAVGRILDTLADTGLDANTWVVFLTDHGAAFPRAKSTLYEAGTGIAMIIRPPTGMAAAPVVYDDLFSGVDLVPTLLELLGVPEPVDVEGISRFSRRIAKSRYAITCTPARPTTTRSIRSAPSARKSSATSRITRTGRCWICHGISRKARPDMPSHRWLPHHVQNVNSMTCVPIPVRRITCWPATVSTAPIWSPLISLSACMIGASRQMTSYHQTLPAAASRRVTPRRIYGFTIRCQPVARGSPATAASRTKSVSPSDSHTRHEYSSAGTRTRFDCPALPRKRVGVPPGA